MKKRFRLAVAVVGVAIVGLLIAEVLRLRQPSYHGKTLDEWLDEYNQAGDMSKIGPASEAIRAMGTNSLPFLLVHIKHTDSALKNKLFNIIAQQHWIKHRFYGPDPYRSASVLALSALGSNAAPLCPELAKMAEEPGINSWWGSMSLLAIGPASVPTLAKVCQNTNQFIRVEAVSMIATLKAMSAPWFSWGWFPQSPPANVRPTFGLSSVFTLEEDRELVTLLGDPDAAVRRASAEAIGAYSNPPYDQVAKLAVGPLVNALKDADPDVRLSAGRALKAIDPIAAAKEGVK
jgi:HEAT repeat protein